MKIHNRLGLALFLWAIIIVSSLSPETEMMMDLVGVVIALFVTCGTALLVIE